MVGIESPGCPGGGSAPPGRIAKREFEYNRKVKQNSTAPKIHVVMDCLNTHQSEALVRLVARLEPIGTQAQ